MPGDDAGLAEQHDHGQGEHERRGNDRQHGNHLEQAAHELRPHLHIHFDVGEEQAHQCGQDADEETDLQGVRNRPDEGVLGKTLLEEPQRQSALRRINTVHQKDRQRIQDKQCQERDKHHDGGDHHRIAEQFLAVQ